MIELFVVECTERKRFCGMGFTLNAILSLCAVLIPHPCAQKPNRNWKGREGSRCSRDTIIRLAFMGLGSRPPLITPFQFFAAVFPRDRDRAHQPRRGAARDGPLHDQQPAAEGTPAEPPVRSSLLAKNMSIII